VADYVEAAVAALEGITTADRRENAKAVSNWVMTEVLRVIGEKHIPVEGFPVDPERLAAMIGLIHNGTISGKIAKEVFEEMLSSRDRPMEIVERKGLLQVSDSATLGGVITGVIERFPAQVQKYLDGNEKLFGFFVGEVMKETRGKANPGIVNTLLQKTLASLGR
jgi:aspartyl-tRNA(Asn)/glutamyl-tRNA(Gln) amidotransferase subunit B